MKQHTSNLHDYFLTYPPLLFARLSECAGLIYTLAHRISSFMMLENFMARAFQANHDMLHIWTKVVPLETAHSMSIVERYHSPLRRAFNIIQKESPDTNFECALQMAVKAINDSFEPDGLVPTLLVSGAPPPLRFGLPTDHPTTSTFKRAVAFRKATAAMTKHLLTRQLRNSLNTRNAPNVTDILSTLIGVHVLVYRLEKYLWDSPHTLLNAQGENISVLTQSRNFATRFSSRTSVPIFPIKLKTLPIYRNLAWNICKHSGDNLSPI